MVRAPDVCFYLYTLALQLSFTSQSTVPTIAASVAKMPATVLGSSAQYLSIDQGAMIEF